MNQMTIPLVLLYLLNVQVSSSRLIAPDRARVRSPKLLVYFLNPPRKAIPAEHTTLTEKLLRSILQSQATTLLTWEV